MLLLCAESTGGDSLVRWQPSGDAAAFGVNTSLAVSSKSAHLGLCRCRCEQLSGGTRHNGVPAILAYHADKVDAWMCRWRWFDVIYCEMPLMQIAIHTHMHPGICWLYRPAAITTWCCVFANVSYWSTNATRRYWCHRLVGLFVMTWNESIWY